MIFRLLVLILTPPFVIAGMLAWWLLLPLWERFVINRQGTYSSAP